MTDFGGSNLSSDYTFYITHSESSSVDDSGVFFSVVGVGKVDFSGDIPSILSDVNLGEVDNEARVYGSLGIQSRPLPPQVISGKDYFNEIICIREADELIPIASRDARIKMNGNAPNEGTISLVGYGGGFLSMSPVDNDDLTKGTISVLYIPYDFNSAGVAQKAHSITIDPTSGNESISIIHAEGMGITMLNDSKKSLVMKNASGDATFRLDDDGITMTAQTIVLSGGVIVGEPLLATPLLAGAASQASTKFFLSP